MKSAKCVDNERTNRIGCGAAYSGKLQHCVAKVPWSNHPDGRAHITASLSTIDLMWEKGYHDPKGENDWPAEPSSIGLVQDSFGRWIQPISDKDKERLIQLRRK